MAQLAIALLVLGIVALVIEMILPGGEVFAIFGVIALLVSSVLAVMFINHGWIIVAGVAVCLVAFVCYMYNYLHRKQLQGRLILSDRLAEDVTRFVDLNQFVGKEGKTLTALRPYGDADFAGQRLEVSSDGVIIAQGTTIRATHADLLENKLVVRPVTAHEN